MAHHAARAGAERTAACAAAGTAHGDAGRSAAVTAAGVAMAHRGGVGAAHRGLGGAMAATRDAAVTVGRGVASMPGRGYGLVEVVAGVVAPVPVAVAAAEAHKHGRTVHEHAVVGVAAVDGKRPAAGAPAKGTIEVGACHEAVVLPGAEHKPQVAVAHVPPESEHVGAGVYVEQVVEVDLIHCLVL